MSASCIENHGDADTGVHHGPTLTRAMLESGAIDALMAKDAPELRLLSEDERDASLTAMLAARPCGDLWLFGYGSLIWNPAIRTAEARMARIDGWHRAFCLSMVAGRGSPDRPGLMLALEAGGSCLGTAYKIAEADIATELRLLWRREMFSGAYVPRWVDVCDTHGDAFGSAIAFTSDTACVHYAGNLAEDVIVQRLATAAGALGSAADYLFRTRDGLRACGIADRDLERLAVGVQAARGGR